ncbi:hypothetical protein ET33_02890 [Paenibacillus tyrfis]|uniref:Uncharacterized protein n=1 Tax=Paenibacillus tyrfis TaxID=1501230 RepID=A0A081P4Q5_9BACL|nr:hypothetical protein ET33_02890 [Paenibacillus tyrfis]
MCTEQLSRYCGKNGWTGYDETWAIDLNQVLKLKWHSIYGQILFERILHEAWLQVKENKGAGEIDCETLERNRQKAKHAQKLCKEKERGQEYYTPALVRHIDFKVNHVGELYALVGHVRFDKGGAMRVVPLLYLGKAQRSDHPS